MATGAILLSPRGEEELQVVWQGVLWKGGLLGRAEKLESVVYPELPDKIMLDREEFLQGREVLLGRAEGIHSAKQEEGKAEEGRVEKRRAAIRLEAEGIHLEGEELVEVLGRVVLCKAANRRGALVTEAVELCLGGRAARRSTILEVISLPAIAIVVCTIRTVMIRFHS